MRRICVGATMIVTVLLWGVGTQATAEIPQVNLTTIQGLTESENAAELAESQVYNRCFEDMPCWICSEMGNKICGTLPRTN